MTKIEIHGTSGNPRGEDENGFQGKAGEDKTIKKLPEMATEPGRPEENLQKAEEAEEWKDKYLRLYAELENTKKRLARRLQIELMEKTSAVLQEMLPVADNLERILKYTREIGDQELERGLKITLEAFQDAMAKHGVSRMEPRGKPFNPEYHEALGSICSPQFEEGTVLEVEQSGYLMDGKVLRPAKVIIVSG